MAARFAVVLVLALSCGLLVSAGRTDRQLLQATGSNTTAVQLPFTHLPFLGQPGVPGGDAGRRLLGTDAGAYCAVYNVNYELSCGGDIPVPACCNDEYCFTNNDASGGTCTSSASPFPACCPAFDKPTYQCAQVPKSGTCTSNNYPIPACCDKDTCHVWADGSGVICPSYQSAGCCPA